MFDVEIPEEALEPGEEAGEAARRGPMATAVRETAQSLRERQDAEARIRRENDALAHEHVRLKRAGLVILSVPTHAVVADALTRDRSSAADADLAELKASILALGLSNPIRVAPMPDGRFALIQGWRRLRAFIELEGEHRDGRFTHIPACRTPDGDMRETSYRRMVDENMVRKGVSFAEMARLARSYAADPASGCPDADTAVTALFRSASYQKRSYIRAFIDLLDRLGDGLAHPEALSRNLGLDLRRALDDRPDLAETLRQTLAARPDRSAEEEASILRAALSEPGRTARDSGPEAARGAAAPAPVPVSGRPAMPALAGRRALTLLVDTALGPVRCVAGDGRLTLQGATDFAAMPPQRLEHAIRAALTALAGEDGAEREGTIRPD